MSEKVHIIGAGIAGLHCADLLRQQGVPVCVHERSAKVGGRMQTDNVDSFQVDRGFHVMQTGYEYAGKIIDWDDLSARSFSPGAKVLRLVGGRLRLDTYADPFRAPLAAIRALGAEKWSDLLRVAKLRLSLSRRGPQMAFAGGDGSTHDYLRSLGFSDDIVRRFFRPLFAGIFLESELSTSERMFRFVFCSMARGAMVLPELGIQSLPEQMARRVGRENIRLRSEARAISSTQLRLGGQVLSASQVIIAHPGEEDGLDRTVWTVHFDAARSPVPGGYLVLNGDYQLGETAIAHLAVPSDVQPNYAPHGRSLVTVTVVGDAAEALGIFDRESLLARVRTELASWFPQSAHWAALAVQKTTAALPARGAGSDLQASTQIRSGEIIRCGDHALHASVEGAVRSAKAAALEAVKRLAAAE